MHKLVDVDCWYHAESKFNPADILSGGLRFSKLINNDLWFNGPSTVLLGDVPHNCFSLKNDVPYNCFSLKNLVFKNNTVLMNTSNDSKTDLKSSK